MRRRGGGIGPACAWPDTPALLAHSGGRFNWKGDESRLTYAWAKWDDGDWAFHGHDYRRRNIALRPIAEYTLCRMTKTALVRAPALWVEKEGETRIVVA